MKRLILKVRDRKKVNRLKNFCEVIYESSFLNIVGVEISENKIPKLERDDNVISIRESQEGNYLPRFTGY